MKERTLAQKEKDIFYREHTLGLEKEQLIREQVLIDNERLHITSQQETLRVAWEQIKKLQK